MISCSSAVSAGQLQLPRRVLKSQWTSRFSEDYRRSRKQRQSRHVDYSGACVGKLSRMERRKYTQNASEEECRYELAG